MPQWFLLMLPQLVAGLGKLIGSKTALNKANIYNSPVSQLARLKAAGLPYAAFEAGQAGAQSQLPDFSGFDNIGNAVGMGIQQSNQVKMFTELLRKAMADADVSENLRDVSNEETIGSLGYTYKDPEGKMVPIARISKLLDFQLKEYGTWSAKYRSEMEKIDNLIKSARFKDGSLLAQAQEEFNRIVNANKLADQLYKSNEAKNAAFQKIVNTMSKGGLNFFEALLIQMLSSMSGGFSGGGMNLGF